MGQSVIEMTEGMGFDMMTGKLGRVLKTAMDNCSGLRRDHGGGGSTMKTLITAAVLGLGLYLTNSSTVFADGWGWFKPAQGRWGLLTPEQRRAYQACLNAAWVYDYCRENSRSVSACIIANGGANFPMEGYRFTHEYCWYAAQNLN
jgi:hypothetical protein